MTANFLCSVANYIPLNEREARLLAAKFEATPCYAEYSALCAIEKAAKAVIEPYLLDITGTPTAEAQHRLCVALDMLNRLRS